ncbi:MAG: hypothetical protein CBC13_05745 [Planctomycetia bacterium TMED53]|nr:MAG: hypothetical protein CBC13_05745 [Planctomycetia bacterium TMED53]
MKNPQGLRIVAGIVALIAMWMCYSLLSLHASQSPDLGLLAGVCGDSGESCSSVVNGRWGVFPPGEEGAEGPFPGIPVAALGWVYYTILASWFLLLGPHGASCRKLTLLMFGLNGLGVLGSLFYSAVMFSEIGTTCGLCLVSHFCNVLIFLCFFLLRPLDKSVEENSEKLSPRHLGAVAVVVFFSFVVSSLILAEGKTSARFAALEEQTRELTELAKDVEKIETAYRSSPQRFEQEAIRADDPKSQTTRGLRYQLVVFSDIQCSNCARFEDYLKSTILPIWNGHLEVVWKHFPNTTDHEYAQIGAQALEAARIQGKFWELKEHLLKLRNALGTIDWQEAAASLGMDSRKFMQDLNSPAVKRRIAEDVALARKAGVRGTPGVFLNRRLVSRLMRKSPGFWELQAESLRDIRESKNQDW